MSRDLVHWEYLPVAIPMEGDELIFSGGAVVDKENTSGFGTRRNPAMVAIYTSAYPDDQKQSLAYSTDRGRTWTKYARNPVLDDADREFRDPKVFWYAPERKWVMAVPDNGDPNTGSIVSPEFTIDRDYLNFEIAGGNHPQSGPGQTAVNLVVDGQVVRTATGRDSGTLNWIAWDVKDLAGKTGRVEIVDQGTGGWGHVLADHFVLSDVAAKLRSDETAVNLIVDGEVVRSTAGKESEALDWASWNVAAFRGREAQIQIVDRNSGGWGHILADQITLADAPAQSAEQRASWLDYGKDYYAAVSWNDVPDGRRLMIGWMNNWQYANQIPTSPWRSAMSVPREVALRTSGHVSSSSSGPCASGARCGPGGHIACGTARSRTARPRSRRAARRWRSRRACGSAPPAAPG